MKTTLTDRAMSKHTPGPWSFSKSGIEGEHIIYKGEQVFARVRQGSGGRETLEANARLIAAAPNMLGTLRKMVAYFESDIEGFDEDDPKYVAFQQARAAIAKATGGE